MHAKAIFGDTRTIWESSLFNNITLDMLKVTGKIYQISRSNGAIWRRKRSTETILWRKCFIGYIPWYKRFNVIIYWSLLSNGII